MRKIILILLLNLFVINLYGQDYSELKNKTFENKSDYKKAEKKILECSNYLLNNPISKDKLNRLFAIQYIMKWTEGINDSDFPINLRLVKFMDSVDLKSIYMAGIVKIMLDEPKLAKEEVKKRAVEYLIKYSSKPENELKLTTEIKEQLKTK